MSWSDRYGGWAPYVPVAKKIAQGRAAAKKLASKEGREPAPVKIEGRKIAKTFWGTKWCENLERYRDFANRLPRGATYVRNGSVADLIVEAGRVRAIIGGSEAYKIEIKIQTLKPAAWNAILRDCVQEIDSLFDLLQGRFSDGAMQRLTQADGGLFPRPAEITMSCSCPDYAGVCKHIAATFYGVAARLDTQPELLFKLRSVDHLELISHATNAGNLERAFNGETETALSGSDLSQIFGIELESSSESDQSAVVSSQSPVKRSRQKKSAVPESAATRHKAKQIRKIEPEQLSPVPAARSTRLRSRTSALKVSAKPVSKKAVKKKSISAIPKRAVPLTSAKAAAPAKRAKRTR